MIPEDLNVQSTNYSTSTTIGGSQFIWLKGCYTQRITNGATILNYPGAGGYVPTASLAQVTLKENGNDVQNVCNILYAFHVSEIAASDAVTIKVAKNRRSFVPTVGMILGKCPSTLSGTTVGAAVIAVVDNTTYYTLTMSAALGALAVTDYLVEVVEVGSAKALKVTQPNVFCGSEMYFSLSGIAGVTLGSDPYKSEFYVHNTAYTLRMPEYPAIFVDSINKSKIVGLIEI